ncbi:MAG TPA: hypothetical protein VG960_06880 [Caulobacteraceae bacterium]|nr:hypothetical protein [Caulobacteraceae bacterium]
MTRQRLVGVGVLAATLVVILFLGYGQRLGGNMGNHIEPQDVTCRLQPSPASERDCSRVLVKDQIVYGPYLALPPGAYRAEFELEPSGRCTTGRVRIDVSAFSKRKAPLVVADFALGGHILARADFKVGNDLGNAPFEFRTLETDGDGCARLKAVRISPLRTGA